MSTGIALIGRNGKPLRRFDGFLQKLEKNDNVHVLSAYMFHLTIGTTGQTWIIIYFTGHKIRIDMSIIFY